MLHSLSARLARSPFSRHMLFGISAICAILYVGYHYGTFDQAVHLTYLNANGDSSLYPDDAFLALRFNQYSFFWYVFLPFNRPGLLEPTMFGIHLIATYLGFWAWWTLSETLFHDPLTSMLGLAALIFTHFGFRGGTILEFSLLNRTVVFPFLLWAIALFLRGRIGPAFLLLGLLYNLHVISVNFVVCMFLFDCLFEFRKIGWKKIAGGLALFIAAALPVLIWRARAGSLDLSLRPEWLSIIARGMFYHMYYVLAPYAHILLATMSGISVLALFAIARRANQPSPQDRTVSYFMYAALLVILINEIAANWLPITIILELQIIRIGQFILVFGYLYFAHYLASAYRSLRTRRFDWAVLTTAYVVAPFPSIPLIAWACQNFIHSFRWRQTAIAFTALTFIIVGFFIINRNQIWFPGIYPYARPTPWYQVQTWARENTAKEAIFITPPQIWGLYTPEWRVFSQRSTVVSLSELLEAAFAPEYLSTWLPRFQALAPGALAQFQGDFFDNVNITAEAYYKLPNVDLICAAEMYHTSFVVVEKPHLRPWSVVYENEQFVVYEMSSLTQDPSIDLECAGGNHGP